MKVSLEFDDSIVNGIAELKEGAIIYLANNIVVFISGDRVGIFSNSTITSVNGDFSKIPTSKVHIEAIPSKEEYLNDFTSSTIN